MRRADISQKASENQSCVDSGQIRRKPAQVLRGELPWSWKKIVILPQIAEIYHICLHLLSLCCLSSIAVSVHTCLCPFFLLLLHRSESQGVSSVIGPVSAPWLASGKRMLSCIMRWERSWAGIYCLSFPSDCFLD